MLTPRMAGQPIQILPHLAPVRTAKVLGLGELGDTFFVDFGKEFQGGIRLHVAAGKAGQRVSFKSGEQCTPLANSSAGLSSRCTTVQQDWQWDFTYTPGLRRPGGQGFFGIPLRIFLPPSIRF